MANDWNMPDWSGSLELYVTSVGDRVYTDGSGRIGYWNHDLGYVPGAGDPVHVMAPNFAGFVEAYVSYLRR